MPCGGRGRTLPEGALASVEEPPPNNGHKMVATATPSTTTRIATRHGPLSENRARDSDPLSGVS